MKLSVVIPTLNEARYLRGAVEALRGNARLGAPHQVVVADCGSDDGTAELAAELGTEVIGGLHLDCRAAAVNAGAARATGDVLLFLDADSRPPPAYDAAIRRALERPRVVGGAFEIRFDGRGLSLRVVELVDRVRYRIRRSYYGDQGVFVRADAFRRAGGFPPLPILESAELCRRLRRLGRLTLLRPPIVTSARRFVEGGVWRVFLHDVRIWFLHAVGLSTGHYGPAYWEENRRRGRRE